MENKYITWIVVLDGKKALLLTKGIDNRVEILDHAFEELYVETIPYKRHFLSLVETNDNFPEKSLEKINQEIKEKAKFIKYVAQYLESCLGEYDRLVIAAPPKALNGLLDALSKSVKDKIILEVDKDFIRLVPYQIRQNLEDLIPVF